MTLDLIFPFYNPLPGWEQAFVENINKLVHDHFKGDEEFINIIVINDGSKHGFAEREMRFLEENIPKIRIISYQENLGKGYALRWGISASTADYCIYSDGDFPFGTGIIRKIYERLREGMDIVIGCRMDGNYFRYLPWKRKVTSKGLIFINKYVLRLPIADTQAGIKGFNQTGRSLFLRTSINRFLFDMEFIWIASRVKHVKIHRIKVDITRDVKVTNFNNRILRQELANLVFFLIRKYAKHQQ